MCMSGRGRDRLTHSPSFHAVAVKRPKDNTIVSVHGLHDELRDIYLTHFIQLPY